MDVSRRMASEGSDWSPFLMHLATQSLNDAELKKRKQHDLNTSSANLGASGDNRNARNNNYIGSIVFLRQMIK